MSKTGRVTVYSSEKNFKTGKGITSVSFEYSNNEEKLKKIDEIKKEQRKKNLEFRKKMKEYVSKNDNDLIITRQKFNVGNPKVKTGLVLKLDKNTGNTTLIVGSSKSGKSTTIMWLWEKYYNKKKFISTLFSPSAQIKLFKGRKNLLKTTEFGKKGQQYIEMQRYINQKCRNKYYFLNIFDDIIDVRFNRIINALILTYRNAKVSTIINLQYVNLLSKSARSNVNNVLFMHLNIDTDIEATIRDYLQSYFKQMGLTTISDMISFYRKMTKNHGIIYIHPSTEKITFHKLKI